MTDTRIFASDELQSEFDADSKVHTSLVVASEHLQLIHAKFEPDGTYALHSHTHEQVSVVLKGRMLLTVGDEVREVGPGDIWYAPAGVMHGGEMLGDEPVEFIDVYVPPNERPWMVDLLEKKHSRDQSK